MKLTRIKYYIKDWLREVWEKSVGMRLALFLDKHRPNWCWASLCVNFGMGYGLFDKESWDEVRNGKSCKAECDGQLRGCYCGKFIHPELLAEIESARADEPPL